MDDIWLQSALWMALEMRASKKKDRCEAVLLLNGLSKDAPANYFDCRV